MKPKRFIPLMAASFLLLSCGQTSSVPTSSEPSFSSSSATSAQTSRSEPTSNPSSSSESISISSEESSSYSSSQETSSSSAESSSSESSASSQILIDDGKIEHMSTSFVLSGQTYVSNAPNCVNIFDSELTKGILSAKVQPKDYTAKHGLIFGYNPEDGTYYLFGFNGSKEIQLSFFDGNDFTVLMNNKEVKITTISSLKILFNNEEKSADFYTDGALVYSMQERTISGSRFGLYAGAKFCRFTEVEWGDDPYYMYNDIENYHLASGTMQKTTSGFEVKAANSLLVNDVATFDAGALDVTYNTKGHLNGYFGLAFCIDDAGKSKYWATEGVSYYYVNIYSNDGIYLWKRNGATTTLLLSGHTYGYDPMADHSLKVVLDGKQMYVYRDGELTFSYKDPSPLKGNKFGLCSSVAQGTYKYVKLDKATPDYGKFDNEDFDVVSGSFYQFGEMATSSSANSMIVSKTPMPQNGTLVAKTSPASCFNSGMVFGLTKPSGTSKYYETEAGLSYYWFDIISTTRVNFGKCENGNVTFIKTNRFLNETLTIGVEVKVIMDGSDILVYADGRLIINYRDPSPLTGRYYGYKAANAGSTIALPVEVSSKTTRETFDYLIFGHSYTQFWEYYKEDFAELGNSVGNIGNGGAQTSTFVNYLDELPTYNMKWGIYWNGINDIDADVAPATIASNLERTMTSIKAKLPNFKCVVIGVNRCTHEKPMARLAQITQTNQLYRQVCDKYDYLHFVDVETLFCDSAGNPIDSYFVDKLHITYEAYRMVAPKVVNIIKANSDK
ncbi:MAG: GDSL-type esterase/lipase family protein [Bacilli bacterium]|nr:GDSL-type esterase/lipase family protein [Bacilli bacterium]